MLMKKLICFFNLCLLLVSCGHKSQVSLVSLVNPLMGTESTFEFSHWQLLIRQWLYPGG